MIRFAIVVVLLAVAGGCTSVRSDLSAPARWRNLGGADIVVARAGKVLPIIAEDTPENRRTALCLAEMIDETCGTRPDVLTVAKGQTGAVAEGLILESAAWANGCGSDAFRIVAEKGTVRFQGRVDFAVYDWCERILGLRWYGTNGKCVERHEEIVMPAVDYEDHPVYARRLISGHEEWARFAKSGNTHRGGVAVHQPAGWFRDARLKAEHPGIFETGRTPMLCYGNPETLAVYQRRIDRHLAGLEDSGGIVDSARKVVTVCPWDAPICCPCAWCRTLYSHADETHGLASPVVWGWFLPQLAAWLAAAHPDYQVSFLPYLNYRSVPRDLRTLPGACEAEVCMMPGLALLKDEACRAQEEGLLRAWQTVTGRKPISWNYGCWPRDRTSAPYVFGRTAQRHCLAMREVIDGAFVCGGERDPSIALSMYIWLKCLWNPEFDVEAVYDGYARRMFGPAARPMRELIALQEACWERPWTSSKCTFQNVFEISYPQRDVARMRALLRKAQGLAVAADDARAVRRVMEYAAGMRRFFAESDALSRRKETVVRVGERASLVLARELSAAPWAKTSVSFSVLRAPARLHFTVRCDEPAAATMDFGSIDGDFVWGDDCVTIYLEGDGGVKATKIYKNDPRVRPDATGWTVCAEVPLSDEALSRGYVRGNVVRWRVGDRRQPEAMRVPGSRYEQSRLGTCYTQPDDDPAAFVCFSFKP